MMIISGCARSPLPPNVPAIDPNLPRVEGIKTITDMTEVGFEWTPHYDEQIEGYYIYRQGPSDGEFERVAKIQDRYASHYVDSGLLPQTSYNYRMSTYTSSGQESPPSSMHVAQTKKRLESVPFLQAIVGLPHRVKLLWRPHPEERVASYIIERNEINKQSWDRIAQVKGRLNAEYIDANLKENHLYRYRVIVQTYDGVYSSPSQVVEARTKPLPKRIENIKATTNLPQKIVITWEPSSEEDISHYRVYRAPTSILFYTYLAKTNEPRFEDLINSNGTDRYYKVTAVDKDGLESLKQSTPIMGATLDIPLPPAITQASMQGKTAIITWTQVDGRAVKYDIIKKGAGETQEIQGVTSQRFEDRALKPGERYTYEIISVDENGLSSKPSQEVLIQAPKE